MKLLIPFLFVSYSCLAQTPAKANATDRCLTDHEAKACDEEVIRQGSLPLAEKLGDMGCRHLNSKKSCFYLGEYYRANKQAEQAQAAFKLGCDLRDANSCERMAELKAAAAKNAQDFKDVKAIYDQLCAQDRLRRDDCNKSRLMDEEIHKRSSDNFKTCLLRVKVQLSGDVNYRDEKIGAENTDLVSKDACEARCNGMARDYQGVGKDDLRMRAQCMFGGEAFGRVTMRSLHAGTECITDSTRLGTEDVPLFRQCFCQNFSHEDAAPIAQAHGMFIEGSYDWSKTADNVTWFRCTMKLNYNWDGAINARSPQCPDNLKALKKKLRALKSAPQFELDLTEVACKK